MALRRDGPELVMGLDDNDLLAPFNLAGVLAASDVHVARRLARLGGERDQGVVLAAALAVRAPRAGHVLADLAELRQTVTAEMDDTEHEVELTSLPWPPLAPWLSGVAASPLVAVGLEGGEDRPLRLVGVALYLDRYWRDERAVGRDLRARSEEGPLPVDPMVLAASLPRLFPGPSAGAQRQAAANALARRFSVIAGGPGTGKTTTVARLLALVEEQALGAGGAPPLVALVAPTGKAAARMAEAVHNEAASLPVDDEVRRRLLALEASTVHRLLGRHPASSNRFRHNGDNQLPHDMVVVDEASMMSLPLMARLLEAVRSDARLLLVGDHEQLASVEAGAVFGDIVGPAVPGAGPSPAPSTAPSTALAPNTVPPAGAGGPGARSGMAASVTMLHANYRFAGPLAELADAIRAGDGGAVMKALSEREGELGAGGSVQWLPVDATVADAASLAPLRAAVVQAGRLVAEAAEGGDGAAALDALARMRLLCAHRSGRPASAPGTPGPNSGWPPPAGQPSRRRSPGRGRAGATPVPPTGAGTWGGRWW